MKHYKSQCISVYIYTIIEAHDTAFNLSIKNGIVFLF